jgi:hypothetical protein
MQHVLAQIAPHPDAFEIRPLLGRLSLPGQHHVSVPAIHVVGGFR